MIQEKSDDLPSFPKATDLQDIEIKSKTPIKNFKHERKKRLAALLEDCVKEWCEHTTSHGFSNMVRTDSWIVRLTWIFLVLISFGYCIYSNTGKIFILIFS
jgi:hypothetical protein